MKQNKMYIDVDGVVVVWNPAKSCIEFARGFGELLRFCKIHAIQPYWLTNWSNSPVHLEGIGRLLWPDICPTMAHPRILRLRHRTKASLVDYRSNFVWIEDGITEKDVGILRRHHALDRFFWTSGKDPNCLRKFMKFAEVKLGLKPIRKWKHRWSPAISKPPPAREKKA